MSLHLVELLLERNDLANSLTWMIILTPRERSKFKVPLLSKFVMIEIHDIYIFEL